MSITLNCREIDSISRQAQAAARAYYFDSEPEGKSNPYAEGTTEHGNWQAAWDAEYTRCCLS